MLPRIYNYFFPRLSANQLLEWVLRVLTLYRAVLFLFSTFGQDRAMLDLAAYLLLPFLDISELFRLVGSTYIFDSSYLSFTALLAVAECAIYAGTGTLLFLKYKKDKEKIKNRFLMWSIVLMAPTVSFLALLLLFFVI